MERKNDHKKQFVVVVKTEMRFDVHIDMILTSLGMCIVFLKFNQVLNQLHIGYHSSEDQITYNDILNERGVTRNFLSGVPVSGENFWFCE